MKKPLLATTFVVFPLSAKTTRLRTYGCIAILLSVGCTATQTRWDATNIRKEVMVYYNDQIMENLIKAKNHLPFVHVDISLLTSQGSSQISGTIGGGETTTNTGTQQQTNQTVRTNTTSATPSNMVAGTIGVVGMLAHAAMRPFTYSVTPQQTETLSIQAAPALGSQAIASMSQTMTRTKRTEETWETVKTGAGNTAETEKTGTDNTTGTGETWAKVTTEKTPKPVYIYERYEKYAKCPREGGVLSESPIRPKEDTYVPGTLRKGPTPEGRTAYYFIANKDREAYYKFCKELFIKGQSQTGGLERALQQTQAAAALPTR